MTSEMKKQSKLAVLVNVTITSSAGSISAAKKRFRCELQIAESCVMNGPGFWWRAAASGFISYSGLDTM